MQSLYTIPDNVYYMELNAGSPLAVLTIGIYGPMGTGAAVRSDHSQGSQLSAKNQDDLMPNNASRKRRDTPQLLRGESQIPKYQRTEWFSLAYVINLYPFYISPKYNIYTDQGVIQHNYL